MTWVDGVVLIALAASAALAFLRGFVREALGILAWVLAIYVALNAMPFAAAQARRWIQNPDFADPAAFVIVFILILILGSVVARIIGRLIRRSALGGVDRILGLAFGLLRGAALVVAAYIGAGMMVDIDQWPPPVLQARSLPYAYRGAAWVVAQLPPDYRPRLYAPPPDRQPSAEASRVPAQGTH
ncbi:MAG: CvpA family protein [Acidisphaera sp.]|nr:CvpA family protein [Acidisphaera sp.]